MTTIAERLGAVRHGIAEAARRVGRDPEDIRLIAVSKTVEPERVREVIAAGQCDLGENKVQEGVAKAEALADLPIRWSMIGHLQTNKARDAVRFATEVQSLDRLPLPPRWKSGCSSSGSRSTFSCRSTRPARRASMVCIPMRCRTSCGR